MHYLDIPHPCSYLPDQTARLEHLEVDRLTVEKYSLALDYRWRRFGTGLFRPRCPSCQACRPIRVDVAAFRPDRSQRRAWKSNAGLVDLDIGEPSATAEKLDLYTRYHAHQEVARGWPSHGGVDRDAYISAFVANPIPTREWTYRLDGALVGVGYVDDVPGKLSAIYFYHDPAHAGRSLGTWNVLSLLEHARERRIPHLHLGYYVEGCGSMVYKSRYVPSELMEADGRWHPFRTSAV